MSKNSKNNKNKKNSNNESKTDLPDIKTNAQTENKGKSMKEKI
jgi:hypothetical protein